MWFDIDSMKDNCPKEIESNLDEIIEISREFLDRIDIYPNQWTEEIKVDLQTARDNLNQIIGILVSIMIEKYEEKDTAKEFGLKLKFEEDVGVIVSDIKEKHSERQEGIIGITNLLRFSGELKTTWIFLIYYPIIIANRNSEKRISTWARNMIRIIRTNASILGFAIKPMVKTVTPSKYVLPKASSLFSTQLEKPKEEEQEEDKDEEEEEIEIIEEPKEEDIEEEEKIEEEKEETELERETRKMKNKGRRRKWE